MSYLLPGRETVHTNFMHRHLTHERLPASGMRTIYSGGEKQEGTERQCRYGASIIITYELAVAADGLKIIRRGREKNCTILRGYTSTKISKIEFEKNGQEAT